MAKDYYQILEIGRNATVDEIKKVYRRLAMQNHPDKMVGKSESERKAAEEKFKDIAEAYSVLSDPEKKNRYDMFGSADGSGFGSGFNANEIFEEMMRGFGGGFGFSRHAEQKMSVGKSIKLHISVTVEEMYNHVKKSVRYRRPKLCGECGGTGHDAKGSVSDCKYCHGTGVYTKVANMGYATVQQTSTCQHCNGSGKVIERPCKKCKGSGLEIAEEEITFNVPYGVFNGGHVVMKGEGGFPERGEGMNGDLFVVFDVVENNGYRISPDNHYDLIHDSKVPILDLITGGDLEITLPDGTVKTVVFKSGTREGTLLKIRGYGLPVDANRRGDLYVKMKSVMPSELSESEMELISKLKQEKNFRK